MVLQNFCPSVKKRFAISLNLNGHKKGWIVQIPRSTLQLLCIAGHDLGCFMYIVLRDIFVVVWVESTPEYLLDRALTVLLYSINRNDWV